MTPPPPQEPPSAGRRGRLTRLLRHPRTGEFLFDVAKNVTSAVTSAAVLYLLGALADLYPANPTLVRNLALWLGGVVAFALGAWLVSSRTVAIWMFWAGLGCYVLFSSLAFLAGPKSGWWVVGRVGFSVGVLLTFAGVGATAYLGPDANESPNSRSDA